ncbi:triadin-like [Tupaia chinensis]|uniref:triadin-like n=1 Tax=Tupaia chinensis TaxID=246437 RepID=UPI000FFB3FBD|nr:triadin-like [Tupaia chinensis]
MLPSLRMSLRFCYMNAEETRTVSRVKRFKQIEMGGEKCRESVEFGGRVGLVSGLKCCIYKAGTCTEQSGACLKPGKAPEIKQETVKVAAQAAAKKDEKKEDSKKAKKAEEAKSPKKEHSESERAKEEAGPATTKKAVPGKKEEKTTKTVEQGKKK